MNKTHLMCNKNISRDCDVELYNYNLLHFQKLITGMLICINEILYLQIVVFVAYFIQCVRVKGFIFIIKYFMYSLVNKQFFYSMLIIS